MYLIEITKGNIGMVIDWQGFFSVSPTVRRVLMILEGGHVPYRDYGVRRGVGVKG